MSYCLKPACVSPQNSDERELCQTCGAKLALGDRYWIVKPIGQGGFGKTVLATDRSQPNHPRCVVKQFWPQQQGTNNLAHASALFRQEALRLQALGQHAQIPTLLDYLEKGGQQYLVQTFIDGPNLAQALTENGAFSEAQILTLLDELLPVLAFIPILQG